MQGINMQLNNLPLQITFLENGCLIFNRMANFLPIIDYPENGICAIISEQDVYIGADTVIEWGSIYEYKEMPELLSWLIAQKMILPNIKGI